MHISGLLVKLLIKIILGVINLRWKLEIYSNKLLKLSPPFNR